LKNSWWLKEGGEFISRMRLGKIKYDFKKGNISLLKLGTLSRKEQKVHVGIPAVM